MLKEEAREKIKQLELELQDERNIKLQQE